MNSTCHGVAAVIEAAIAHSPARNEHKGKQARAAALFTAWLTTKHPEITDWAALRPMHVVEYIHSLTGRGIKPATVRLYVNPVAIAGNFAADNYDAAPLPVRKYLPKVGPPAKRYLTIGQLLALVSMTTGRAARLGFILGGFAGLRPTEIMRLRPCDLDSDGTLRVAERLGKNEASRRMIPLCGMALGCLREALRGRGERDLYAWTDNFSHKMRAALNHAANVTGDETYRMVTPRDAGRKTFVNIAATVGAHNDWIRAYCGHAPGNVLDRNYRASAPVPEDLPLLKAQGFQALRRYVVEPVEAAIATSLNAAKTYE